MVIVMVHTDMVYRMYILSFSLHHHELYVQTCSNYTLKTKSFELINVTIPFTLCSLSKCVLLQPSNPGVSWYGISFSRGQRFGGFLRPQAFGDLTPGNHPRWQETSGEFNKKKVNIMTVNYTYYTDTYSTHNVSYIYTHDYHVLKGNAFLYKKVGNQVTITTKEWFLLQITGGFTADVNQIHAGWYP